MKRFNYSAILAGLVCAAVLCGCGQQGETKSTTDKDKKAVDTAVSDTTKAVSDAASQAKDAVQKAAGDVKDAAQKAAADTGAASQAKVQGVVDKVKSLIAENKYKDALATLQEGLKGLQLTPEQQKLVDSLKDQIQKAIASSGVKDAAKSVGDLKNPLGK